MGVAIGRASEYFDFFVFGIASVLVFPYVFFLFLGAWKGCWRRSLFFLRVPGPALRHRLFMTIQRHWGRGVNSPWRCSCWAPPPSAWRLNTYDTLGVWTILLLALFRILQGFALGGSRDACPLLAPNAPRHRRSWYAMLGQLGAPIGFLVAAALFLYLVLSLSSEDFLGWGWRYPFFVAFAINVVALFACLRLVVTDEYTRALEEGELEPIGTRETPRRQGYNIFIGRSRRWPATPCSIW